MIIRDPIQMRIQAFGDAAFSLLHEQYKNKATIKIGEKEFIAANVDRKFSGQETTNCGSNIQEFFRVKMPWIGEGLPPVGIDVEIHNRSGRGVVEGAESFIGTTCKVTATFINMNGFEMVAVEDSGGSCMCFRADMCGPVRTPEQIEQEISYKAICQLMDDLDIPSAIAARAYDLGYRKFEIVDEPT